MNTSKLIAVIHADSESRILLRTILQARNLTVLTDHSCTDLLSDRSGVAPGVILLDRAALGEDGMETLSQLRDKWSGSEIVFLPEQLQVGSLTQLLIHLERLLDMKTTHELLAV